MERTVSVGAEGLDRVRPGATYVGPARQVVDDLGPHADEVIMDRCLVGYVDRFGTVAVQHLDFVARGLEVRDEVGTDEPVRASDEGAHQGRGTSWVMAGGA